METQIHNIPQQRISRSAKTDKWAKETFLAYKNMSKFGLAERIKSIQKLYSYYNGNIDETDYHYVTQPYKKARGVNFPSKLRNYPIIKPVIDVLIGEKAKRPMNYSVIATNADAVSMKEEAIQQKRVQLATSMFAKALQGEQMDPQLPPQIMEEFESNYVDRRAEKGQASLNFLNYDLEIYDKIQKNFFHFLVSGECYSLKGVINNEVYYDILNTTDVDYDKDPDIDFVEDGDWAMVRRYMHASTVIDYYKDDLTNQQILDIETPQNSNIDTYLLHKSEGYSEGSLIARNRLMPVITLFWKSRKRIGFLNYFDEMTGSFEEIQVEDGFKIDKDLEELGATIEWQWVNEVWETTEIDERFYIRSRPIPDQRTSMDNPSKCKLPVNGRKYSNINSPNISLVSIGVPYQINYNVYKYRLELSIARSKDIIAQMDINLIPKKWKMDKFMEIVEGTGIAWVDYNKEGTMLSPQHQTVLDMSVKVIDQYLNLLESIVIEWERVVGVNRQRQGNVGEYEGKGTSQQAILQSTNITEDIFRKFAHFEQRELQGLLDYSREAWLNGKKAVFALPDGTIDQLDIDGWEHMESNYGVFVTHSGKELEKLDGAKELSKFMLQNGVPASAVLEMIDGENFSEIKRKIGKAEAAMQQLEQAQKEAEMQMQQQQAQVQQQIAQMESMDKEKDRLKDIEIALINAESKADGDERKALIDLQKMFEEIQVKQRALDIEEKKLDEQPGTT